MNNVDKIVGEESKIDRHYNQMSIRITGANCRIFYSLYCRDLGL